MRILWPHESSWSSAPMLHGSPKCMEMKGETFGDAARLLNGLSDDFGLHSVSRDPAGPMMLVDARTVDGTAFCCRTFGELFASTHD